MSGKWSDYFIVDDTSPSGLRWKVDILDSKGRKTKAQIGKIAGSLSGQQRWQVQLHQKVFRCHRIIYEILHGEIPEGMFVDHEDGNEKNNHPSNLVAKTARGNQQNRIDKGRNTSGTVGVCFWTSNQSNLSYVKAFAVNLEGKIISRLFSINKLGKETAYSEAVKSRKSMIESLNKSGAQYTERHGKVMNG